MKAFLIIIVLFLSGCSLMPKKEVVFETQYIIRKAIDEQKQLPPYPPKIDVTTASQIELAEWIKASEERQWALENIIKALIKYYEKPVEQK